MIAPAASIETAAASAPAPAEITTSGGIRYPAPALVTLRAEMPPTMASAVAPEPEPPLKVITGGVVGE